MPGKIRLEVLFASDCSVRLTMAFQSAAPNNRKRREPPNGSFPALLCLLTANPSAASPAFCCDSTTAKPRSYSKCSRQFPHEWRTAKTIASEKVWPQTSFRVYRVIFLPQPNKPARFTDCGLSTVWIRQNKRISYPQKTAGICHCTNWQISCVP